MNCGPRGPDYFCEAADCFGPVRVINGDVQVLAELLPTSAEAQAAAHEYRQGWRATVRRNRNGYAVYVGAPRARWRP